MWCRNLGSMAQLGRMVPKHCVLCCQVCTFRFVSSSLPSIIPVLSVITPRIDSLVYVLFHQSLISVVYVFNCKNKFFVCDQIHLVCYHCSFHFVIKLKGVRMQSMCVSVQEREGKKIIDDFLC